MSSASPFAMPRFPQIWLVSAGQLVPAKMCVFRMLGRGRGCGRESLKDTDIVDQVFFSHAPHKRKEVKEWRNGGRKKNSGLKYFVQAFSYYCFFAGLTWWIFGSSRLSFGKAQAAGCDPPMESLIREG